jgi:type VI protein secretion system component Hcp
MIITTVERIVVTATAVLVTAAAPSAAIADFHFQKPVDKASPTIYQNAGSSTSGTTTPPAK